MMHSAFSAFSRLLQYPWWRRFFSLVLALLLCLLGLLAATTPAVKTVHAQNHGCAPNTPALIPDAQPAPGTAGSILINEVLSQPDSTWNCSEAPGIFSASQDSWLEFYNTQNYAIDLYTSHMQISIDNGSQHITTGFSFGSAIPANGFFVFFPFETQTISFFTDWVVILSINGVVIDQTTIPTLQPDQSYARVPDSSTTWLSCGSPTIDASNNACAQPVTPTPTKTPVSTVTPASSATLTPTGTRTPIASVGPTGTGGTVTTIGGSGGGGGPDQPGSSGTQPAWGQLQLPTDPVSTPDLNTTAGTSSFLLTQPRNFTTAQNNGTNTGLIVLLVSLALALLAILAGWWKFWRKRGSRASP